MFLPKTLFLLFLTSSIWNTRGVEIDVIDVLIIGAGSSGAAAAREFSNWNSNDANEDISYLVLEANSRIGGRILDVEFGGDDYQDNPMRTSGGFRKNSNSTQDPWENIGCHCDEASCTQLNVEVGAGWFTGDEGVELASSCNPVVSHRLIFPLFGI